MKNNINIFNNPVEISIRILILLNNDINKAYNLEKLTYFDYLMLHCGDLANAPKSILPNSPYRFFEFCVNKEKIAKSIEFLWKKGLIDISYKQNGIFYQANRLTGLFVNNLSSEICKDLTLIASWIVNNYYNYTEDNLKKLFYSELKSKNTDFSKIGAV